MPNLASLESVVSIGFKAHTFGVFASRWHAKLAQMPCATRNAWRGARGWDVECVNCRARSVRRRDAQAMRGLRCAPRGGVGGTKDARMVVCGACGAEMRKQCVGCDVRGLDNVGELQAAWPCRMGQGCGTLQWDMWRGATGRFGPQGAGCAGGRVRTWETTGNPTAR